MTDIQAIFTAQRANRLSLKRRRAPARIAALKRLRDAVVRDAEAIDEALHRDMERTRGGIDNGEVASVLAEIDTAIAGLSEWMADEIVEPSPRFADCRTYIRHEPRGVVLVLGPWNFPFSLTVSPLVAVIAAGNAAIVKPNEMQPNVSAIIQKIIASSFDVNEIAVIEGDVALAEALQALPFDHIFFTGSPAVGKRVMAAAARHLSTVTLELGGKCPAIVDANWPVADAARKIVLARFFNGGQLCLAVDHVWVPRARRDALVTALSDEIDAALYVDGIFDPGRMARIVDARNHARVAGYIADAQARGATVRRGGAVDAATLRIEPTILVDVPLDADAMREEIFGPVLPVIAYDHIDEVAHHIDAGGKPLAVYIFSGDAIFCEEMLTMTSSGGVTINNVILHQMENRLPFGGVNGSGIGRYRGIHGFHELSNPRSILSQDHVSG